MKQKEQNQSLYDRIIGYLRNPFWRMFANVFSHGGTHLAFLLLVFSITAILVWHNYQGKITPHIIDVKLTWQSNEEGKVSKNAENDSLRNVLIHLNLNSRAIDSISGGNFKNGIDIEFDGDSKSMLGNKGTFKDKVVVSLRTLPSISSDTIISDIGRLAYQIRSWVNTISGEKVPTTDTILIANYNYNEKPNPIEYFQEADGDTAMAYITPIGNTYRYKISILSDEIGVAPSDPYYYYFISFPSVKFSGDLVVDFSIKDHEEIMNIENSNIKYLQYNYIYPKPDIIDYGRIEYNTKEKKEIIKKNKGVVIQAIDVDALNNQNRNAFLYSVLVGTGLAFAIDIIIQLIRELRRLQRKEDE